MNEEILKQFEELKREISMSQMNYEAGRLDEADTYMAFANKSTDMIGYLINKETQK